MAALNQQTEHPLGSGPAALNQPTCSGPAPTSWADVVKETRPSHGGITLDYAPLEENEDFVIHKAEVEDGLKKWETALVGFVHGGNPSFSSLKAFVEKTWGKYGVIETILMKNGMIVFKCSSVDIRDEILDQSPWPFYSKMMFLKPWKPDLDLQKEKMDRIPIWIKLPNLKLHYYNAPILSKFGSKIGKPLFTDHLTANQRRVSYARLCVEIGMNDTLPEMVTFVDECGVVQNQPIEYEWLPQKCDLCKSFGHAQARCELAPKLKTMWVPVIGRIDPPVQQDKEVEVEHVVALAIEREEIREW